jgi:hypothetical protein
MRDPNRESTSVDSTARRTLLAGEKHARDLPSPRRRSTEYDSRESERISIAGFQRARSPDLPSSARRASTADGHGGVS